MCEIVDDDITTTSHPYDLNPDTGEKKLKKVNQKISLRCHRYGHIGHMGHIALAKVHQ